MLFDITMCCLLATSSVIVRLIKTHEDREGGGRELDCSLQWGETNAIERQEDDTENRQTFS